MDASQTLQLRIAAEDAREEAWEQALAELGPGIHPVDREATRVWLAFWPAKLQMELRAAREPGEVARRFKLEGQYRLEQALEESLGFFYGARYWDAVRRHALRVLKQEGRSPAASAREIAAAVAREARLAEDLVVGVSLAAVVAAQQVGLERLAEPRRVPARLSRYGSPQEVLRMRRGGRRFWSLLARRHRVVWDESEPGRRSFPALEGQNLTMAAAQDRRAYRDLDPRRVEGPIPVQCRSGQCGTCWIGILGGRERVSPIETYEARQLEHFGYVHRVDPAEPHPPVRLACQCVVHGDLSVVIPPWNGLLQGRRGVLRAQYSAFGAKTTAPTRP